MRRHQFSHGSSVGDESVRGKGSVVVGRGKEEWEGS